MERGALVEQVRFMETSQDPEDTRGGGEEDSWLARPYGMGGGAGCEQNRGWGKQLAVLGAVCGH